MKQLKRLMALLLTAATLAGLLSAAPASASGGSGFYDISDPAVAEAAETLRLLGVVDGTGSGSFRPAGTLTRAEFCKMAVEALGMGEQEPAQRNRTIFTDVGPSHWARGYINLATSVNLGGSADKDGNSTGGTRLIMGVGDGTFRPDRPITYGEACTILMRMLGYGNTDVASGGASWYDGYVAVAQSSGLSDGVRLSGASNLNRGQAALLFYNLLFTELKDSEDPYLTKLGGKIEENVVVLSTEATAADGSTGSVLTSGETYRTDRSTFSSELNGKRGRLVLDKAGKLLAILPDEESTFRSATVMGSPQANAIPLLGDETVDVKLSTQVYKSDSAEATTYEKVWTGLRSGTNLVLCYNGSGKLDYVYIRSASDAVSEDNVLVAKNKPAAGVNPFTSMIGSASGYQIYKNGAPAQVSDLRQYDVATYDSGSKTLFVSDLKLSGLYESAYPNSVAPSTVTVMGYDFTVLPGAIRDLSSFKVGDKVTLLLTTTGQVAGAVSTDVAKSNAVGVATLTGTKASIALLDGIITLEGDTTYSEPAAAKLNGRLVTVSSYKRGYLSLSEVRGKAATAPLDLDKSALGTKELAPGVRYFEQVGNGKLVEIDRDDIALNSIPAAKITYVGYDWAGRVDKLVLDDITGDRYEYGLIFYQPAGMVTEPVLNDDGTPAYNDDGTPKTTSKYKNGAISVTNGSGTTEYVVGTVEDAKSDRMGGIAGSLDKVEDKFRLAGYAALQKVTGIRRSQIDADAMTLSTPSLELAISEQVQIYNEATGSWYSVGKDSTGADNLQLALAFSDNMTAYYDKSPEQGGKVRILVIE